MKVYKLGDNMIFFIFSVMGMIIDIIFLTNLYNRKHPIKRYWLMIIVMMAVAIIERYFIAGQYIVLIYIISYLILLYLFTKDKMSWTYLSVHFALMISLEILLFSIINLSYNYVFLLQLIIKLFFIFVIFNEINKAQILLRFKSITRKILWILFSFICLCSGIYLSMTWR